MLFSNSFDEIIKISIGVKVGKLNLSSFSLCSQKNQEPGDLLVTKYGKDLEAYQMDEEIKDWT